MRRVDVVRRTQKKGVDVIMDILVLVDIIDDSFVIPCDLLVVDVYM